MDEIDDRGTNSYGTVLAMMRATLFWIVVTIVDYWLVLGLLCIVGEKRDSIE